jgi:hypothetical protein
VAAILRAWLERVMGKFDQLDRLWGVDMHPHRPRLRQGPSSQRTTAACGARRREARGGKTPAARGRARIRGGCPGLPRGGSCRRSAPQEETKITVALKQTPCCCYAPRLSALLISGDSARTVDERATNVVCNRLIKSSTQNGFRMKCSALRPAKEVRMLS